MCALMWLNVQTFTQDFHSSAQNLLCMFSLSCPSCGLLTLQHDRERRGTLGLYLIERIGKEKTATVVYFSHKHRHFNDKAAAVLVWPLCVRFLTSVLQASSEVPGWSNHAT